MNIVEKIKTIYPELTNLDFSPIGSISVQNDGSGDYIKEWNHPTLAKPTDEELA